MAQVSKNWNLQYINQYISLQCWYNFQSPVYKMAIKKYNLIRKSKAYHIIPQSFTHTLSPLSQSKKKKRRRRNRKREEEKNTNNYKDIFSMDSAFQVSSLMFYHISINSQVLHNLNCKFVFTSYIHISPFVMDFKITSYKQ